MKRLCRYTFISLVTISMVLPSISKHSKKDPSQKSVFDANDKDVMKLAQMIFEHNTALISKKPEPGDQNKESKEEQTPNSNVTTTQASVIPESFAKLNQTNTTTGYDSHLRALTPQYKLPYYAPNYNGYNPSATFTTGRPYTSLWGQKPPVTQGNDNQLMLPYQPRRSYGTGSYYNYRTMNNYQRPMSMYTYGQGQPFTRDFGLTTTATTATTTTTTTTTEEEQEFSCRSCCENIEYVDDCDDCSCSKYESDTEYVLDDDDADDDFITSDNGLESAEQDESGPAGGKGEIIAPVLKLVTSDPWNDGANGNFYQYKGYMDQAHQGSSIHPQYLPDLTDDYILKSSSVAITSENLHQDSDEISPATHMIDERLAAKINSNLAYVNNAARQPYWYPPESSGVFKSPNLQSSYYPFGYKIHPAQNKHIPVENYDRRFSDFTSTKGGTYFLPPAPNPRRSNFPRMKVEMPSLLQLFGVNRM